MSRNKWFDPRGSIDIDAYSYMYVNIYIKYV